MTIDISFIEFAKCKTVKDTNFFFPEDVIGTNKAIAFCQDCPVKTPCGLYAIENNINHGVWGGLSIRARVVIRRNNLKSLQAIM
jgi:WhiB family redox-sensing transcriptional regulator